VGSVLETPLRIGAASVRNRLYRAPVLEGAGDGDDAVDAYARQFVENARHGVGLIIQGSSCVLPEGRTSPGMTCVDTREKVLRLAPMVDAVHREGAAIFLQAGHGGLGSANAKLLDQFLSPFYNRRTDEFGGSLEGRARVLRLIREEVARRAGADFPCTVKVPVERTLPGFRGAGLADALRLARLVEEWGYDAVTPVEVSVLPDTTLSRGGVPDAFWTNPGMKNRLAAAAPARGRRVAITLGARWGGRRAPFEAVWNRGLFSAVSLAAGIPVFAVGGIRTAEEVHGILDRGEADMVGIGRPFYAEPDLAGRILGGWSGPGLCRNSNRCVAAQMLGMKGGCYNPEVPKRRPVR
jgi:2,4-dienoyl-CoA reductase-like NADH-dependent reductase (Old Yellow Enzyme family)